MTNTSYPADLPFGAVLAGREHLGMFLQSCSAPSLEIRGYVVPRVELLFSNGCLTLPVDAIVEIADAEAVTAPF